MRVIVHSVDITKDSPKGRHTEVSGQTKIESSKTALGESFIRLSANESETKGDGLRGGRDENIRVIERSADVYLYQDELSELLIYLVEHHLTELSYDIALKLSQKLVHHALEKGSPST